MTEQEIEQAIVEYLRKELDNYHVTIETGTVNAPAIFAADSDAGAIVVAYNGDPTYLNIPAMPDPENFSRRPRKYHQTLSYVISIGYHNLNGAGENLYTLLNAVRLNMINLYIDDLAVFVPVNVKPPVINGDVWWFQAYYETKRRIDVAIHSNL